VFKLAGLLVNLVPGQIEIVGEKTLAQAVATNDPGGFASALLGENYAMLLVSQD